MQGSISNHYKLNKMKRLIFSLILITAATSCKQEWNKEYAKKTCVEGVKKSGRSVAGHVADKICDCVAEKLVKDYKSEQEANSHLLDVVQISKSCNEEYFKNNPR